MPLQVIEELRVGEKAWDNIGINRAFKAVDAVQRKAAPALKRAQQFGPHSSHVCLVVALSRPTAAAGVQGCEHGTR